MQEASRATCDICRQPLTSRRTSSVFFDRQLGEQSAVAHDRCGETACGRRFRYSVGLERIIEPGDASDPFAHPRSLEHWRAHLGQKVWWTGWHEAALERACLVSQAIRRPRTTPSTGLRARVLERDRFRCRRCGASADTGATIVIDHVVPVAAGGRTEQGNLQTLCTTCNSGKLARPPHAHDQRGLGPGTV